MTALVLLAVGPLAAQRETARFTPADGAVLAAGAALFFTPRVFDLNQGPPSCAPCDRQSVPWFDRWVIAEPREPWGDGSTILLAGLGVATAWDLLQGSTAGTGEATALSASAVLAVSVTELLKALTARNRPVLYTAEAVAASRSLDSQRSWPSGHSAAAFALAVSYAASLAETGGPEWPRWAALLAATGVGSLRVAAAQHFPSDVLAGAAVGALSALAVHAIRF